MEPKSTGEYAAAFIHLNWIALCLEPLLCIYIDYFQRYVSEVHPSFSTATRWRSEEKEMKANKIKEMSCHDTAKKGRRKMGIKQECPATTLQK